MAYVIENNVRCKIAAAVGASDVQILVQPLPSPRRSPPEPGAGNVGILTLVDNPERPNRLEIITYSGRTLNDNGTILLTGVTRAQESTVALSWSAGEWTYMAPTKTFLDSLRQIHNDLAGLQGGDFLAGEMYHATAAENAVVAGIIAGTLDVDASDTGDALRTVAHYVNNGGIRTTFEDTGAVNPGTWHVGKRNATDDFEITKAASGVVALLIGAGGNVTAGNHLAAKTLEATLGNSGGLGATLKLSNNSGLLNDAVGIEQWDGTLRGRLEMSIDRAPYGSDFIFESGENTPAEIMRLTADGRLGIGETSPDEELHIKGATNARAIIETSGSADPALIIRHPLKSWILGIDNSLSQNFSIDPAEAISGTTFVIQANGYVGIGDSTPGAPLVVKQAASAATAAPIAQFNSYAGRTMQILQPDGADSNSPFQIQTGNSFQFIIDAIKALTINPIGNIGIGETTPEQLLHITSAIAPTAIIETTGTNDPGLVIRHPSTSFKIGIDNNRGYALSINNGENLDATGLTLLPSGNVGIGISIPQNKLHINGTIQGVFPTSSVGLNTGTIWNNSGVANIA